MYIHFYTTIYCNLQKISTNEWNEKGIKCEQKNAQKNRM